MKKLFFSIFALCMGMCTMAQSSVYVYQKDGKALEIAVSNLDSISFTKPTTGTENGYTWVDLGLPSGLRWASMNVGAAAPEEYGDYFAWGEIATKTTYDWSNYKYANGSENTITKYCNNSNYGKDGFTDELTTLKAADDAATQIWGGNWRMPTKDEWQELTDNCDWKWTNDYSSTGKAGHIVSSKTNGNTIFLPAAGYYDGSELGSAGSYGYYWSSSLFANDPNYAHYMDFGSDDRGTGSEERRCGQSVRAVLGK
jgi:uncharacterized protein (TIGR02145 family)